jgi:uncharacterized membrane protein
MTDEPNKTRYFRRYFFTGILVTAPIGLTLYLTWIFIAWMDALVTPYVPMWLNPNNMLPFNIPGVGLVMTLGALTFVGWLMAGFLGRWFTRAVDAILNRVPVVKTMYGVIKQVLETALADQSRTFKEAVLVQFPHENAWVLGFVTGRNRKHIDATLNKKMLSVFVPTTPNLTSGYLIFVEEGRAKPVSMPSDEALKLVISGGLVP